MKGLGEIRLPLRPGEFAEQWLIVLADGVYDSRSLHFGGCGVTEHAAPHLGTLAIIPDRLRAAMGSSSRSVCTRPVSPSMSGAGFSEPCR